MEKTPKIGIIGDIMIDINYIANKSPTRFAPESPNLPIYNINNFTYGLGGAANVAEGLKNLGFNDVILFGIVGNDFYGTKTIDLLKEKDIKHSISIDETRHTTQKHRKFLENTLISRFDIEDKDDISGYEQRRIIDTVINSDFDVIILSDYGKGVLTEFVCSSIIKYSADCGVYTFVDPKIQCYKKYSGCFCFKPNFYEATKISGGSLDNNTIHIKTHEEAESIIRKLHELIKFNHIVLTDGNMGLYTASFNWCTGGGSSAAVPIMKHIPSANIDNVLDVTGAGDIIMIVLVYVFIINGHDIVNAAEVANYFGGVSVSQLGNYKITRKELFDYIHKQREYETKQLYYSKLSGCIYPTVKINPFKLREVCTNLSQKIVFTNGCFDILHSAHLRLLNYCHSLGDILVVGLNTDSSIKRLKGAERPINNLRERMACLREIGIIDYIYSFDEDTPIDLIRELKPDIIVKGGDYSAENVVGHEYAGRVEILEYIDDVSTTKTIERITERSRLSPVLRTA